MRRRYVRPEISVVETCVESLLHGYSYVRIYDEKGVLIDEVEVVEGGMPSDADDEDKSDIKYFRYSVWDD